jgi:hypothetical protein
VSVCLLIAKGGGKDERRYTLLSTEIPKTYLTRSDQCPIGKVSEPYQETGKKYCKISTDISFGPYLSTFFAAFEDASIGFGDFLRILGDHGILPGPLELASLEQ